MNRYAVNSRLRKLPCIHSVANCQSNSVNVFIVCIQLVSDEHNLFYKLCLDTAFYQCICFTLQDKAQHVMHTLWGKRQRSSNLVGTVINIHTGDWVRRGKC